VKGFQQRPVDVFGMLALGLAWTVADDALFIDPCGNARLILAARTGKCGAVVAA
jgi:hypothetical protein